VSRRDESSKWKTLLKRNHIIQARFLFQPAVDEHDGRQENQPKTILPCPHSLKHNMPILKGTPGEGCWQTTPADVPCAPQRKSLERRPLGIAPGWRSSRPERDEAVEWGNQTRDRHSNQLERVRNQTRDVRNQPNNRKSCHALIADEGKRNRVVNVVGSDGDWGSAEFVSKRSTVREKSKVRARKP